MGMIGGGEGAFIGAVHRMAAALDGRIDLVCGALSRDAQRARSSALALGIAPERAYPHFKQMLEVESTLPSDMRMDFVAIVAPNHVHYEAARAALEAGFDVLCEKPLTTTLDEARRLAEAVARTGQLFAVAFNYTGYPLVKQARHVIHSGALGEIRKVVVEYQQGWLAFPIELTGQKQAAWRTDPAQAGPAGCLGDIATHAANLAEYVTGLPIVEVSSELTSFVEGRRVDDDVAVLLRFEQGARGVLHATQIAIGKENGLTLRVHGTRGSLEWHQEEPNTLVLDWADRPREVLRAGANYVDRLAPQAIAASRLPCGHPEGFLEAFANIYRGFVDALLARESSGSASCVVDYPKIDAGVRSMAFVDAVLRNARSGEKWTRLRE